MLRIGGEVMEPVFIEKPLYIVSIQGNGVSVRRHEDVLIEDNVISCIGECRPPRGSIRINARRSIVLPGLINAHTHAGMIFLRGSFPDHEFWEWLRRVQDVERRLVSPRLVYLASRLACIEMLVHGVVGFVDMYFYPIETVRACADLGLYVATGSTPANINEFLSRVAGNEKVIPMLILHSLYGESEEVLEEGFVFAGEHGLPVHIHVSETRREVYLFRREKGEWPVEYMYRRGWLRRSTILVHLNWVLSQEIELIARAGSGVVVCPSSSMRLAEAGFPPIYEMLGKGIRVGIGTDGSSGDRYDVLGEIREALLLYRHNYWDTRLRVNEVFSRLIINSYEIIGLNGGRVEAGYPAHLSIMPVKPYRHLPLREETVVPILVLSGGWEASHVIINGELVLTPERKKMLAEEAEDIAIDVMEYTRGVDLVA